MNQEILNLRNRVAELEDHNAYISGKLNTKDVEISRIVGILESLQSQIEMLDDRTQSLRPL